jgi:cobalamin biosynthesis protein CobT
MKLIGVISTAVLSFAIGATAPVFAQQEQHDQQEEQKDKPAQDEKKAQPEKSVKPEEKGAQPEKSVKPEEKNARQEMNSKPAEKNAQQEMNSKPEEKNAEARPAQPAQRGGGNRIPDDRYKANFGREHTFHVSQGDYGNRSFQYGGYSFGFVGAWPSNWLYTQDVFVVDIDGVYYLCNPMYPGVNIALVVNL